MILKGAQFSCVCVCVGGGGGGGGVVFSNESSRTCLFPGGYERFSAEYPFLRTQKIIYTPMVCLLCNS